MTRMEKDMDELLLTPFAVSLALEKSVGAVRLYALNGRLPFIATSTGRRLFRKSDVEKFKAEMMEKRRERTEVA